MQGILTLACARPRFDGEKNFGFSFNFNNNSQFNYYPRHTGRDAAVRSIVKTIQ